MNKLTHAASAEGCSDHKQTTPTQCLRMQLTTRRGAKTFGLLAISLLIANGNQLTGLADQNTGGKPKITGVELLNTKEEKKTAAPSSVPPPTTPAPVPAPSTKKKSKKQIAAEKEATAQAAAAQAAQLQAALIKADDKKTTFYLQITGERLEGVKKEDVHLYTTLNQEASTEGVQSAGDGRILVKVTADVPMELTRIVIKDSETQDFRLTIAAKKEEPLAIKEIETSFETFKSPTFPNQYTIFVTKKGGPGSFESDPNRMRVEILPPGASNISIRQGSNPQQLAVDFLAPDKFEVKNIVVTVYDSGNLDSRKVVALATQFKEKPAPADPNQPSINNAELIYIQRSKGFGRLKLEGSGFGDYERLSMTTEEILEKCFPLYIGKPDAGGIKPPSKILAELRQKVLEQQESEKNAGRGSDTERKAQMDEITKLEGDFRQRDIDLTGSLSSYFEWRNKINQRVKLELVPRNPNLKIDGVSILYIDDKLIDVYFEFQKRGGGYAPPFRLEKTTLTVAKNGAKTAQTIKDGDVTITLAKPGTFIAAHDVGFKRDQNLRYSYTLMDVPEAIKLFGRGVAENFYVIQLSVTNTGMKKVAVPLAAIQAEVEWLYGKADANATSNYSEGPDTIAPIPLAAVSGFFDAYLKTYGKRAMVFNVLQGIGTLGAAVIPFVGPSFRDGVTVLASAGIPALKIASGDLSGQQLQNLTGLSWQSLEAIAPGGGSVTKYIYIQRGAGEFTLGTEIRFKLKRAISNILGVEVVGFEVVESEAKQATPTQSTPNE